MTILEKTDIRRHNDLITRQTEIKWLDGQRTEGDIFYVESKDYLFFLDTALDEFNHIRNKVVIEPYKSTTPAKLKSKSLFKLYDYQVQIRDFLLNRFKKNKVAIRLLVALAPGKGKTLVACEVLAKLNRRFAIVILAKYIDKWTMDVMKNFDITEKDIYVVQGSDSLLALMEMKTKDIPKIVIFSNRTMHAAMGRMLNDTYSEKYPMELYSLLEHCDMDTVLLDEAHQEFNSLYNICTILNPMKILGLSATFNTDNRENKKHFLDFFKSFNRVNPLGDDRYRNVIAVEYNISNMKGIVYKNWFTKSFGHTTLEASIMKYPKMLDAYLSMISFYVYMYYIKRPQQPRGKLLIFAGTIKMVEAIKGRLKRDYSKLDIRKYTSGDPFDNVLSSDICCSTIGSSGTAIDIEGLTTVIQTVSLLSSNGNIQAFGRLRAIEGAELNFIYLWCSDIPSMVSHHKVKINLFKNNVVKWIAKRYPKDISPKYKW